VGPRVGLDRGYSKIPFLCQGSNPDRPVIGYVRTIRFKLRTSHVAQPVCASGPASLYSGILYDVNALLSVPLSYQVSVFQLNIYLKVCGYSFHLTPE
jgi:hypothetical protein